MIAFSLTPATLGEWVIFTASVLVAVGVVWRQGIRPAYRAVKAGLVKIHHAQDLMEQVETIVKRELSTNGGASMKDQLNRAARRMEEVSEQVAEIRVNQTDLQATQRATTEVLEGIVERKEFEHDEIWEGLTALGIDRRKSSRESPDH